MLSVVDAERGVIEMVVRPRDKDKSARSELRAKLIVDATDGSRIPIELTFTEWTPWPRFLRLQLPFASTH